MKRAAIDVHIEELVLHGFNPAHRHAIAEAIQAELGRMLAAQPPPGCFRENAVIDHLDGGSFSMRSDAKPGVTGTRIAQQVYRGLNR